MTSNGRRRQATVYDHSNLRIHGNGILVASSNAEASTSTSQPLRKRDKTSKDSRGNTFARDAAGKFARGAAKRPVVKSKSRSKDLQSESDEDKGTAVDVKGKGKEKVTRGEQQSKTPEEEEVAAPESEEEADFLSFLDDQDRYKRLEKEIQEKTGSPLPLPSSDFLKAIQYQATKHWTERGQNQNLDKVYRAKRKQQRLARQQQKQKNSEKGDEDDESSSSGSDSDSSSESEGSQEQASAGPRRQKRTGIKRNTAPKYNDMYKRMDGLALVCLAMVIQEHAYSVLQTSGMDPNWVALEAQMVSEADADGLRVEIEESDYGEEESEEELDEDEDGNDDEQENGDSDADEGDEDAADEEEGMRDEDDSGIQTRSRTAQSIGASQNRS